MTTEEAERFNATVGRQLRAEIAAAGGSLAGVARTLGMSRSALDNYVTGKRAIPVPVAYEICDVLGVNIRTVLERAQERFAAEQRADAESAVADNVADITIHPRSEGTKSAYGLAAKRGTRKADQPYAE